MDERQIIVEYRMSCMREAWAPKIVMPPPPKWHEVPGMILWAIVPELVLAAVFATFFAIIVAL